MNCTPADQRSRTRAAPVSRRASAAESVDRGRQPGFVRVGLWTLWCAVSCSVLASAGLAQEQPSAQPIDAGPLREQYVPFQDLAPILGGHKKGVFLPRDEFRQLVETAREQLEAAPIAPRKMVLSSATYEATVAGNRMLISARIDFRSFAAGWQILALPLRGLAVESATVDAKPARLGRDLTNGRTIQLITDRSGPGTLLMELSAPLQLVGSDQVAAFELIAAPSATLNMTLPVSKRLHLKDAPVEPVAVEDDSAKYRLALGGQPAVRLRITDGRTRESTAAMVFATSRFAVDVGSSDVSWRVSTSLRVYGEPLGRVQFSVPRVVDIVDVQSTGLESWSLEDDSEDGERTAVTLVYRQPFRGNRSVAFHGMVTAEPG